MKITTLFDEQASKAYQMGVGPMNRMYAMMGMTGSGAHIAANNALAAQVYDTLSKQYSALYTADLEAQERDWQEKVLNFQSQIDAYGKIDVMTREDAYLLIEQLGALGEAVVQPVLSWAAQQGEALDIDLLMSALGKMSSMLADPNVSTDEVISYATEALPTLT